MNDCIFCKVIKGELPSKKVYEDDHFLSFEDIAPKAPVHLLVVPKRHFSNLDEANEGDVELLGKLLLVCKKIAADKGVIGNYKAVTNIGELAGQTVMHMHFHLIGGWKDKKDVVTELKL